MQTPTPTSRLKTPLTEAGVLSGRAQDAIRHGCRKAISGIHGWRSPMTFPRAVDASELEIGRIVRKVAQVDFAKF
jgi:hypothetical protein